MSDQIPNAEEQTPDIDAIFEQVKGLPPEQQVPALIETLKAVIGQMADVDERLTALDKEIHEDFFGPIHEQYQAGVRGRGIEELKQKHGSLFDEHADALNAFGISDVYSFLYDKLEELRKSPDYTEEMGESSIKDFHKGLLDRVGKIRGKPSEPPAAVEVAISKEEPASPEPEKPEKPKSLAEKKRNMRDSY